MSSAQIGQAKVQGRAGRVSAPACLLVLCAAAGSLAVLPPRDSMRARGVDTSQPARVHAEAAAELEARLERALFAGLSPEHQRMLTTMAAQRAQRRMLDPRVPPAACFAEGTPQEVMQLFNQGQPGFGLRFNVASRWQNTATDGPTLPDGLPVTLRYSYVPDGTIVRGEFGTGDRPSDLFAWLNGIYGSPAAWQAQFDAIFARWTAVSGINFVFEPNDDGQPLPDAAGVLNIRGDVRIAGAFIDGNSGILAYNYFPDAGDMVIDSADNFYNDTSGNSLRLRNVLAHEVGHGMGYAHVCPISRNKLMEPFVATTYDGPRHDDIRAVQFQYGDVNEPNNTPSQATALGPIGTSFTLFGAVGAPAVANASTLSLRDSADVDIYTFTASGSGVFRLDLSQVGYSYDDSEQSCGSFAGSCCFNGFATSSSASTFVVELRTNAGALVQTRTFSGASTAPLRFEATIASAGTYRLSVSSPDIVTGPSLYTLQAQVATAQLQLQGVTLPGTVIPAAAPFPVEAQVGNGTLTLNTSSVRLFSRAGTSGAFSSTTLARVGTTNRYTGSLPAYPCGTLVQYYLQAASTTNQTTQLGSPASPLTTNVGNLATIFTDAFETDQGWTTSAEPSVTSGGWVRVDPIGTIAAPEDDTTPAAGVNAFITQQSGAFGEVAGTNDVDGGRVFLTSPIIDVSGRADVRVRYQRWFSNTTGGTFEDAFRVEVSTNGGSSWVPAETAGPGSIDTADNQAGWRSGGFSLAALGLSATSQLRVRFIAEDLGAGTVIEAGVDDFVVTGVACVTGPTCNSIDFNNDGIENDPTDIEAFLSVYSGGPCLPSGAICDSIDFNNDGIENDPTDIESFLSVYSGGPCL